MFIQSNLLKIPQFDGAQVRMLDDDGAASFAANANSFIDNFPSMEEKIKAALKAKDFDALGKLMAAVCDMLRGIYAGGMASGCLERLTDISETNFEDLQAFVVGFIKSVASLSIDLQMAAHHESAQPAETVSAQPGAAVPQPITQPAGSAAPAPRNAILAVDDRHFFLASIKSNLHGTGYRVTCINSGRAALNYLEKHRPDLFLLDIDMPEMDGYELARKIRASGQEAPIIFLTGNSKKESVVRAIQAGAADFIIKPVTKDQLLERIGKYIEPDPDEWGEDD